MSKAYKRQIIQTCLQLGRFGSDYIALVPVTGIDLHFRPGMDENKGIAGALPGDQQSTGLLDLEWFDSGIYITKERKPMLSLFCWCR